MKGSDQPVTHYLKDYRPSDFLIDSVELVFDLRESHAEVEASLQVRRNPLAENPDAVLRLDGEELELCEIAIDGEEPDSGRYRTHALGLEIEGLGDTASIRTRVRIHPQDNTRLEGLYKSGEKFCTQCEAEGFRRITYFLDRPDVMATYRVRIEADRHQYPLLLSNGNPVDRGELAGDRHFVEWQDPFRKPSYLFALVAGDLDLLEDTFTTASGREVLLQVYVDKGKLDQCEHAMASLKKAMAWDERTYGLEYDLDIYMIVAVSDFNMGAMENKGLNIFNTKYVLASQDTATDQDFIDVEAVIAHEYFHNWTGNRVTCRDWFQLSLKEGLTVFRDQQFTADQISRTVKRIDDVRVIRAQQFAEDAGPMAHPIRPDAYIEMNNFYTVTVYNKGAEVIRMLHTLLGADGFRRGIDLYFERHDGEAVTCEDFVAAMADANQMDLDQFRRWYSQAGTPEVTVETAFDESNGHYRMTFRQSCQATPGQKDKQPFLIPIRFALLDATGAELQLHGGASADSDSNLLQLTDREQTFVFSGVGEKPVPSLLRDFSAPVRIQARYSDDELAFLFRHDSNDFNRWDAGQQLMIRGIFQAVEALAAGREPEMHEQLVDACRHLLTDPGIDDLFRSHALTLPALPALIESVDKVDFDNLIKARKWLRRSLAEALADDLLAIYDQHHQAVYARTPAAIASRGLKNLCLDYLLTLERDDVYALARRQLGQADNMTDAQAALTALAHSDYPDKDQLLRDFYDKWQHEELVVNKWFAIQATIPDGTAVGRVRELLRHPAFSLTNPNNIRSLIGAFAGANLGQFHRADGAGYELLARQIQALYSVNPQTAARLTGLFNRWKKFDQERQRLMQQQLRQILSLPELSRDVFEIASKALA